MFILKKSIPAFLLPPGIFIIALLALAWRLWRSQRRGLALFGFLLASLLWALSTGFMANMLLGRLESGFNIPQNLSGDVIVLLGGGIYDKVPDLTGRGAPSEPMVARIVTAVRLQRQLHLPIIVTGGAPHEGRSPEAPIVRRFLLDLGVADRDILMESKSRDTMGNARFSREIIKRHDFRHPLLVTSAFHMRRSVEAFKRAGVTVTPVPANFVGSSERRPIWADFLPGAAGLHASATALREHLGLLFYWLGGQKTT